MINDSKSAYPVNVAIGLIAAAILLSFVDLLFLKDVVGQVLHLGEMESILTACALGLVGIGIMAHQGIRIAHERPSIWSSIGHYAIWVLIGVAFAAIRLFSAYVLQLGEVTGDTDLVSILGMDVRQSDLITAPIMILLYLATGLMVKDGFKNLYINPEFKKSREERKEAKRIAKEENRERAMRAEQEQIKRMEEARALGLKAASESSKSRKKKRLVKAYIQAQKNYTKRLNQIKDEYQEISKAIDFVRNIDKQEAQFEEHIKPNLLNVVDGSIDAAQNSVALSMRAKSGQDIEPLRSIIATYNAERD